MIDDDDQPFEDNNNVDKCDEVLADVDGPPSDELPLLFFFDCECTGRSMYNDHIIEVSAKVVTVPDSVSFAQHHYGSLVHSSWTIAKVVQSKCGITA